MWSLGSMPCVHQRNLDILFVTLWTVWFQSVCLRWCVLVAKGKGLTLIGWNSQAKHWTSCFAYITSLNPYSNPRERQHKPFIHSSVNNIESTVCSRSVLGCQALWMQRPIRQRVSVLMEHVCNSRKSQTLKQIIRSAPGVGTLTTWVHYQGADCRLCDCAHNCPGRSANPITCISWLFPIISYEDCGNKTLFSLQPMETGGVK